VQGNHDWFAYRGWVCCRLCGVLKRIGTPNKPCPGAVRVTTRGAEIVTEETSDAV